MKLEERPGGFALYKEKTEVGCCLLTRTAAGADGACLTIVPEWRRKGYGSYLLKEILRRFGGYDRETATVFTAPLPAVPGEEAFWAKFGFREEAGRLCRRRTPDLTAVKFVQDFLAARLQNPQLLVDATCGKAEIRRFCAVWRAGRAGCWALTSSPKPLPPPDGIWLRTGFPPSCTAAATQPCCMMSSPVRRLP